LDSLPGCYLNLLMDVALTRMTQDMNPESTYSKNVSRIKVQVLPSGGVLE
jgi:hypothetical protein